MASSETRLYDVAVIGEWHLAFVTAACFAARGKKTALIKPAGYWAETEPRCPIHEVGVDEELAAAQSAGNLDFLSADDPYWHATVIWMAVDTPVNEQDEPQLEPLTEIAKGVAERRNPNVFAVSSQIPLGYCRELESLLGPRIAYIPENLRLGQGIATFAQADRTVIGGSTLDIAEQVHQLMDGFDTEFIVCGLETAEMVKHANNAFLATSISFANEMARIGSTHQVDNYAVARALKLDARIGPKAYVAPGLGFAGGTLPRDLRVLEQLGRDSNTPTPLTSAVLEVNRSTSTLVAEVVLGEIKVARAESDATTDTAPRVLLLGYTYKADTDTLRRSMTIEIARELAEAGVECHGFDPFLNGKDLTELIGVIEHHNELTEIPACEVVLLMTARPMFREIDWRELEQPAQRPTTLIDTQQFLDSSAIKSAGLNFRPLWAPS